MTRVWQIETDDGEGNYPVYANDGVTRLCWTMRPDADQAKASAAATLGLKESEIEVCFAYNVEDLPHEMKLVPQVDA